MVRRAVATRIGDFAKSLEKEHVLGEIITLFKQLSTDDQVPFLSLWRVSESGQGSSQGTVPRQPQAAGPHPPEGRDQDPPHPAHHRGHRGQILARATRALEELRRAHRGLRQGGHRRLVGADLHEPAARHRERRQDRRHREPLAVPPADLAGQDLDPHRPGPKPREGRQRPCQR